MLSASDIRIGNILDHIDSEYIMCVTEIHKNRQGIPDPNEYWLTATGVYRDYLCDYPISGFKPIELTEEWLIKFGFEQSAMTEGKWRCDKIVFCFYEDEVQFVHGGLGDPKISNIKYIHQLQNLYHSLTGEHELTIKMPAL